jgi:squalene-hopene/tetraprenyl-beta-curcumene cyclase
MARRGGEWLCRAQHASGGWGPVVGRLAEASQHERPTVKRPAKVVDPPLIGPSVEETALAVTALTRLGCTSAALQRACEQGLAWLIEAVDNGRHKEPAAIGFYFAKLWYYERLYPRIFAVEALEVAAHALSTAEMAGNLRQASVLQPASP